MNYFWTKYHDILIIASLVIAFLACTAVALLCLFGVLGLYIDLILR